MWLFIFFNFHLLFTVTSTKQAVFASVCLFVCLSAGSVFVRFVEGALMSETSD